MIQNLQDITAKKRAQLLVIFKHDITRLFYDIGCIIQDGLKKENALTKHQNARTANEKSLAQDKILLAVAEQVSPVFGDFLSYQSLQKMRMLFKQYKVKDFPQQDIFDVPDKLADYFKKKNAQQFRKLIEPTLHYSPEIEEIKAEHPIVKQIIYFV